MANRRELKRNINYVFEDIIEAAYLDQALHPETDKEKSEAIVDEAIADFDALIAMMNVRDVENKKAHFKKVQKELEEKATDLVEKINAL